MKKSAADGLEQPLQCYVHITRVRKNGFIEFDFSMGDPLLYVELILPFEAFDEFCANNHVQHLSAEQAEMVEYDRLKWRYGKPGLRE